MNITLSKDTDKIICSIYKEYLIKSDTLSKSNSKVFTENDLELLFPDIDSEDLDDCLNELTDIDLINKDILGNISLSKYGIIYMENRFKNGLKEVLEFLKIFI